MFNHMPVCALVNQKILCVRLGGSLTCRRWHSEGLISHPAKCATCSVFACVLFCRKSIRSGVLVFVLRSFTFSRDQLSAPQVSFMAKGSEWHKGYVTAPPNHWLKNQLVGVDPREARGHLPPPAKLGPDPCASEAECDPRGGPAL